MEEGWIVNIYFIDDVFAISNTNYISFYDNLRYSAWIAKQQEHFAAMLDRLCPANLEPNPLPILMRAVNRLWLAVGSIHQPCWRTGRWKSRT